MNLFVGLACVLTLTARAVTAEGFFYEIMEMSGVKPYDQISCPEYCKENVAMGMNITSMVLQSAMNNFAFPLDFCDACEIQDLNGFSYTDECFMSEKKDVYDHHVEMTLPPTAKITCKCHLSNDPKVTATRITSSKVPLGKCGYENNQNTYKCDTFTCPSDNQSEDTPADVTLNADLSGSILTIVLRSDTRQNLDTGAVHVFPIQASLLTWTDPLFTVQASTEFDKASTCLDNNQRGFYCHILANAFASFFDCWDDDSEISLVDGVLREYLSCKNYKKNPAN